MQLPDMSSLRTRGLDAALRAIGFVLWFSFILFLRRIESKQWACQRGRRLFCRYREVSGKRPRICHDVPSLSKEIAHPILFFPEGSGPTLIVPCAIAFKIFGKNEVLPGLTAILTWGSVLTLVLVRISRRIDGLSFLLGVSVMCAAFLGTCSFTLRTRGVLFSAKLSPLPSLSSHTGSYQTSDSRRHRHFCAVSRLGARSRRRFSPQSPRRALSWCLL